MSQVRASEDRMDRPGDLAVGMPRKRCATATTVFLAMVMALAGVDRGGVAPLLAAPLDEPICSKLRQEGDALAQKGARADMALGPQAARAQLSKDRIEQVRRLIALDGMIRFRCTLPKAKGGPGDDTDEAEVVLKKPANRPRKTDAAAAGGNAKPPKTSEPGTLQAQAAAGAGPAAKPPAVAKKGKPIPGPSAAPPAGTEKVEPPGPDD